MMGKNEKVCPLKTVFVGLRTINWLTSARKPLETKGLRALYVLTKTLLQHFCNTQVKKRKKEWLQVANKRKEEGGL